MTDMDKDEFDKYLYKLFPSSYLKNKINSKNNQKINKTKEKTNKNKEKNIIPSPQNKKINENEEKFNIFFTIDPNSLLKPKKKSNSSTSLQPFQVRLGLLCIAIVKP